MSNGRILIWDLETDGLLLELTKIHILVIKDVKTKEVFVFHNTGEEDNIAEGIAMLNEAEMIIGHNIIGFDMPALWKIYGDLFDPQGIIRDTVVMCRMLFADEKERDFRRIARNQMDGKYLGSHELGAWGQRLGFPKGDYADVKKLELIAERPELALKENKKLLNALVWEKWSQAMEEYAVQDVEVTDKLWEKIDLKEWSLYAIVLEHEIHALMERVQANGFPFDLDNAHRLVQELRDLHETLSDDAIAHFGKWWVPKRWLRVEHKACDSYVVGRQLEDGSFEGDKEKKLPLFTPREIFGEDSSRFAWGEIAIPKRTQRFQPKVDDATGETIYKPDTEKGCPYCPVEIKEFNPNSRQMIIDRLTKIYGWEPQDFTDEGNPSVNDEVLRDLAKTIPICQSLAEIFYYSKRLGQLIDGKNGLVKKAEERGDSKIHPRIITGGTVTNRASHSNPNIAQVPRVVFKNILQWKEPEATYDFNAHQGKIVYGRIVDGAFVEGGLTPLLNPDTGEQFKGKPKIDKETGEFKRDKDDNIEIGKTLLKGRAGDHGWDFRNLFRIPKGWVLMGADQKGIELRALGHYMAEFDNGAYMRLVVESDPHDLHQKVMELDSRDTAKTAIYALIYGAQDFKLGTIVDPALAMYPDKAKRIGAEMRTRLMTRIPAFGQIVRAVQSKARRGFVEALDGRELYVRGQHSALNTLLQGAGATVAKLWCVNFERMCEDDGLVHGWNGDFAILAWVHDEIQVAVRDDPRVIEIVRRNFQLAATEAGETLHFRAPVDIDVKTGMTWAATH